MHDWPVYAGRTPLPESMVSRMTEQRRLLQELAELPEGDQADRLKERVTALEAENQKENIGNAVPVLRARFSCSR